MSLSLNLDVVVGTELVVNSVECFENFHSVSIRCEPCNSKKQYIEGVGQ